MEEIQRRCPGRSAAKYCCTIADAADKFRGGTLQAVSVNDLLREVFAFEKLTAQVLWAVRSLLHRLRGPSMEKQQRDKNEGE